MTRIIPARFEFLNGMLKKKVFSTFLVWVEWLTLYVYSVQ